MQLQRTWNPRYQRANDEFKRFARKIDHADEMAKEYFQVQERLTAQIASSESQTRARKIDSFSGKRWSARCTWTGGTRRSKRTLGQARLIMLDLHDMNLIITKQSLSAHFAALYEEFQSTYPRRSPCCTRSLPSSGRNQTASSRPSECRSSRAGGRESEQKPHGPTGKGARQCRNKRSNRGG